MCSRNSATLCLDQWIGGGTCPTLLRSHCVCGVCVCICLSVCVSVCVLVCVCARALVCCHAQRGASQSSGITSAFSFSAIDLTQVLRHFVISSSRACSVRFPLSWCRVGMCVTFMYVCVRAPRITQHVGLKSESTKHHRVVALVGGVNLTTPVFGVARMKHMDSLPRESGSSRSSSATCCASARVAATTTPRLTT